MILKPCPFCGCSPEIEQMGSARQSMIITCLDCGCSLHTGETFLTDDCRWNTREPSKAVAVAKPKKAAKRFVRPTRPQAAIYFHELGSITCNDDAEDFCDHFDSNGWKVGGKSAMKDWKASIRKWHKNKLKGMFSAPEKTGMLGTDISDTGFIAMTPVDDDMAFLAQTRARALEHQP